MLEQKESIPEIVLEEGPIIGIGKNDKIRRRIDQILELIQQENKQERAGEMVIMNKDEQGMQKMISVIEIVKQKLGKCVNFTADRPLKNEKSVIPEYSNVVIDGEEVNNEMSSLKYIQLNYLDYRIKEDKQDQRGEPVQGYGELLHDKQTIERELKVNGCQNRKYAVLYVYLRVWKDGDGDGDAKAKVKMESMVRSGWCVN